MSIPSEQDIEYADGCFAPIETEIKITRRTLAGIFAAYRELSESAIKPIDGVEAIRKERERQKTEEGWTTAHDDEHTLGELAQAAATYAMPFKIGAKMDGRIFLWPHHWDKMWWKPSPNKRKRELEKAGAMIAAEWDRIDRLEHKKMDLPKRSE